MKIFDCFTFFNELELLELRLTTLYDYVDYFVIVESETTFTGKNKELIFEINKERYSKFLDKIIHIKTGKLPYINNAWQNEFYARNYIVNGLANCSYDDYIILSDVDEIPNPIAIKKVIEMGLDICSFQQKMFYYYVNCMQNRLWPGSVIYKKKLNKLPQEIRDSRCNITTIPDGGWHYSCMGGSDRIIMKLESFAETWTDNQIYKNKEHIERCMESGDDFLFRTEHALQKKFIKMDEINHPELSDFILKYPNFIKCI